MPRTPSLICAKCGSQRVPSGKRVICAVCSRQRVLAHQKEFPEKANARQRTSSTKEIRDGWTRAQVRKLWDRYKMTPDEYENRCILQESKCAICQQTPELLVVDHDHATLRSRSLLCKSCNFGLGSFGDDPERLIAAAEYLKTHRQHNI